MLVLQAGVLACVWALQYLAMRGPSWPAVISSQLAGNALAKVAPGGGAIGGALQYRMLVQAGLPRPAGAGRADGREPPDLRGRARDAGARRSRGSCAAA